ncbi:rhomboid family intramembrane serine protease [Actinomadura sp. NPDC047616]|uniref:rhomboid family intramembrane serine protease n=1 Tax=Actinomadura sp. NPDC047616 TaxID=3155914 RepID=UPI0033C778E1
MVIPIHDVNPVRRAPLVTTALVLVNVVVFLLTPGAAATPAGEAGPGAVCGQAAFYDRYAAIPRELVGNRPLPRVATGRVVETAGGRPACATDRPPYAKIPALSVLYAMFLHGSWLHLLGNMLYLWIFGNNIEDRLGRLGYLLLYLVSGYAAAYGFALAAPESTTPLIGASGAIAGVLGAYLVAFPRARVWSLVPFLFFIPLVLPAWAVLGLWFLLQWFYSLGYTVPGTGSVAYLAHVIGFVTGVLVMLLARAVGPGPASPGRYPPDGRPAGVGRPPRGR